MNELMIALGKLAEAGIKYLEARTSTEKQYAESSRYSLEVEMFKNGPLVRGSEYPIQTQTIIDAGITMGPQVMAAPKKTRRTKEQIAADEAAAQPKATTEVVAAAVPGVLTAIPAAAPAAANPLGDLGAFGAPTAKPSLQEQIATAQAQTAAIQQPAAIAAASVAAVAAAPVAPKVMTEEESKVSLARSVAVYVKVTAGTGAAEEKLDAARNVFRTYMTTTLKAAKVKDLTHDQRLAAIAWLDAETAKHGGK